MAKSSRENEIKLAFSSPEHALERLRDAGATETAGRAFEDNVLFDLPGHPLVSSGRLLRLRRFAGRAWLTYKGPVDPASRHKARVERETIVQDADETEGLLAGLGFEPIYRYQKFRSTFQLLDVVAEVDETPLGTFIELEGTPDAVDAAARALGAEPTDYILASYRELHERDARAKGAPVGDLLMPTGGRPAAFP